MSVGIRSLLRSDWPAVESIYRQGIVTGHATFESDPPTWDAFDAAKLATVRLVAERDGRVVGWAAAGPVSAREVYRGVAEHSVYVADDATGAGVGRTLLDALIAASEAAGAWTLQASIFPENLASLAVHERAGFRRIGTRERIALMTYGALAGHWRDTILVERRSGVVGRS